MRLVKLILIVMIFMSLAGCGVNENVYKSPKEKKLTVELLHASTKTVRVAVKNGTTDTIIIQPFVSIWEQKLDGSTRVIGNNPAAIDFAPNDINNLIALIPGSEYQYDYENFRSVGEEPHAGTRVFVRLMRVALFAENLHPSAEKFSKNILSSDVDSNTVVMDIEN